MSNHTVSSNPIRKLPISLSNQIAAGEVVERPASILKELIENSIDAGSRHIRIEIEQAGLEKISVTDDGHGIPASELHLAVSPHATSKIYSQEQLGTINTLGFRGEALASIASVSKFEIISRVAEDDTAWKLDYSNKNTASYDEQDVGKLQLQPIAHPVGTTITANNIFYNTPARKKYLKAERTEYLHVERIIKQLILSDFNSSFVFVNNNREVYRFQQATDLAARARRVLKICGKPFYDNTVTLNFQASGMTLTGWLAKAEYSRASADIQYFYINGRIIRDRVIFHAIRSAFKDSLPEGRYVAYVLYLTINTESIDVNVHPTKHEVRFDDMRLVHDFLSHVISQALNSNNSNSLDLSTENKVSDSTLINQPANRSNRTNEVAEPVGRYSNNSNSQSNAVKKTDFIKQPQPLSESFFGELLKIFEQQFLLSETHTNIKLIDIKKAKSFIAYFKLTQQLNDGAIKSKPFLIPNSITLESDRIDVFETHLQILNYIGIELSITGLNTILLRSIPIELSSIDYTKALNYLGMYLLVNKKIEPSELIDLLCNTDLITNIDYTIEQASMLLSELNSVDNSVLQSQHNIWWHLLTVDNINSLFQ